VKKKKKKIQRSGNRGVQGLETTKKNESKKRKDNEQTGVEKTLSWPLNQGGNGKNKAEMAEKKKLKGNCRRRQLVERKRHERFTIGRNLKSGGLKKKKKLVCKAR